MTILVFIGIGLLGFVTIRIADKIYTYLSIKNDAKMSDLKIVEMSFYQWQDCYRIDNEKWILKDLPIYNTGIKSGIVVDY